MKVKLKYNAPQPIGYKEQEVEIQTEVSMKDIESLFKFVFGVEYNKAYSSFEILDGGEILEEILAYTE